jgi:hypothetical protein
MFVFIGESKNPAPAAPDVPGIFPGSRVETKRQQNLKN